MGYFIFGSFIRKWFTSFIIIVVSLRYYILKKNINVIGTWVRWSLDLGILDLGGGVPLYVSIRFPCYITNNNRINTWKVTYLVYS